MSPSLFVILGAVSASVILLTVIMAGLYIRTVRYKHRPLIGQYYQYWLLIGQHLRLIGQ